MSSRCRPRPSTGLEAAWPPVLNPPHRSQSRAPGSRAVSCLRLARASRGLAARSLLTTFGDASIARHISKDECMFQFSWRASIHRMSKLGPRRTHFRARSAARDAETDRARLAPIIEAIEIALAAAEREYAGLDERVRDVIERAAVTIGNGDDEYLHREALDEHHQSLFDKEILNGQRRLIELEATIGHLRFLTAVFSTRFPELRIGHST